MLKEGNSHCTRALHASLCGNVTNTNANSTYIHLKQKGNGWPWNPGDRSFHQTSCLLPMSPSAVLKPLSWLLQVSPHWSKPLWKHSLGMAQQTSLWQWDQSPCFSVLSQHILGVREVWKGVHQSSSHLSQLLSKVHPIPFSFPSTTPRTFH
jgi:hypothetical protein